MIVVILIAFLALVDGELCRWTLRQWSRATDLYAAIIQTGIEMSLDAYDINIFMEEEENKLSNKGSQLEAEDE